MDPLTIAAGVSAVAGLAGAGISAYGAYEQGQATKNAALYQSQVAQNNAKIAKQNADWDIEAGEIAAANRGQQVRAAVGSQKASQGASGVDVNTGSAADVRA